LKPSILIWCAVFFVLGYLLYAAIMAGIGALVPNLREASQATLLITVPMMVPFFLISVLIEDPGGGMAVFFSMFPFTASEVMILRLAASNPPLWQPLLSAALMVLAVLLVIRSVARLFRAQTMLSGQHVSLSKIVQAVFSRG
jgi:ABC-2 type transport system permease protein